jgi:hypothetical protein
MVLSKKPFYDLPFNVNIPNLGIKLYKTTLNHGMITIDKSSGTWRHVEVDVAGSMVSRL